MNDLVCQYVDGTLDAPRRQLVETHAAACPACSRDLAVQREVHESLRARAALLREPAPSALQARVAALVASPIVVPFRPAGRASAAGRLRGLRRFVPASLAAGVLLAVGAGALAPSGSVLAAQLALDHLKCRLIATVDPGSDPHRLEQAWEATRGWTVGVPPSAGSLGVQLVGLRNCLYHDGTMAHVMYDLRGQRLSLFVMPHERADAHALTVLGQQTLTWTKGDRAYAVVAPREAGDLGPVVAFFRETAR